MRYGYRPTGDVDSEEEKAKKPFEISTLQVALAEVVELSKSHIYD